MMPPFKSTEHFLDLVINDPKIREQELTELTKEKYYISKFLNTSYLAADEITRVERTMLLKFIQEDIENENEKIKQLRDRAK